MIKKYLQFLKENKSNDLLSLISENGGFQFADTKFYESVIQKAQDNNIEVILSNGPKIKMTENIFCSGFFDDKKFQLAVAVGKPVEDWVPVFAHESSHMDQFIDDISWWDERSPSCDILDLWLGDKEYLDEELNKAFKNVMELELEFG